MAFGNCKLCAMWFCNVWWNRSLFPCHKLWWGEKRANFTPSFSVWLVFMPPGQPRLCIYTLSVSVFYCIWLPPLQSSCWYLHCSSLLTFKLISAYLLSVQLLAFWSVRSLDNASKLKSFVNPIAWLLESHWELFNINGEGLPDFQSHFLFIIAACISTSCFLHRDNTLLLNCLTQHC